MARYDTAIIGGMVIDGTRMPRRRCDVAICDGRIAKLGRVDPADADRALDATPNGRPAGDNPRAHAEDALGGTLHDPAVRSGPDLRGDRRLRLAP